MDFSKVIEWNIPEGDVLRVLDSSNRIIWQKFSELSTVFSDDTFTVGPYNISVNIIK